MSSPEEEYQLDLKDCRDLMKRSEKIGVLKSKEKDQLVAMFFESKKLIYTLLYMGVSSKDLLRIVNLKVGLQDMLVLTDLRLIIKMVNHPRFVGQGIPLYDLIMHGTLGYVYALDIKFDLSKGYKLSTYATWWIKQHAQRAIEYNSKLIRLPNHVYAEISKVNMVVREYTSLYKGETPEAEEIAIRLKEKYNLDFTVEHVRELWHLRQTHSSLDDVLGNDPHQSESSTTIIDTLSATGENEILKEVEESANKDYVKQLMSQLTHNEQKLINWKYGLIDLNSRTSKEMATIMGMSQKVYNQFEQATMAKLRSLANREKVNL